MKEDVVLEVAATDDKKVTMTLDAMSIFDEDDDDSINDTDAAKTKPEETDNWKESRFSKPC